MPPLVTAIIPCYNRPDYAREAIESALAQTYSPLEIIAVDDGSTDNTPAVLASYADRIRVLTQPNSGVSVARNTAFAQSTGEYIALLDSDDTWMPEKIAAQIAAVERWPEAVLVHTACVTVDAAGTALSEVEVRGDQLEADALERLLVDCYPNTSSCLIRRDAWGAVGGLDGSWIFAEDWEFYLRLAVHGPFAFVGTPLTRYRMHGESKTADKFPHALGQMKLRQAIEDRQVGWRDGRDAKAFDIALAGHRRAYAHACGKLGLLYQSRGDKARARNAFRQAARLDPKALKHRIRYARMALTADFGSSGGESALSHD